MERLYVIADSTLPSVGYKAAQAGHGVAQWMLNNPGQSWNNNFLILLEGNIPVQMYKFDKLGIKYTVFREPDLDYRITAISAVDCGDLVKNLRLLGN